MDEEAIREQISNAETVNAHVARNSARTTLLEQLEAAEIETRSLTTRIGDAAAAKAQKLAEAKLPVEGLTFDEAGVSLATLPFDQASDAERLRVSVAMGIALNPKLRVMLIRDGSLLDAANLELIKKMAEEHNMQIWIERVGSGPEVSVLIEDGTVARASEAAGEEGGDG